MKNIDFENYELLFIWCFVSVILLNKTNVIDEKISEIFQEPFNESDALNALNAHMSWKATWFEGNIYKCIEIY